MLSINCVIACAHGALTAAREKAPRVDAGAFVRLYSHPRSHRLVPRPVAVAIAGLIGRSWWSLSSGRRRRAREWAATLLQGDPPQRQVDRLARRALIEHAMREELFWRPCHLRRCPIEGLECLRAAMQAERGIIVSTAHIGTVIGTMFALAGQGLRVHAPRSSTALRRKGPRTYGDRRRLAFVDGLSREGTQWFSEDQSFEVLEDLLMRREACLLPLDVPGRMETTLLGRPVMVASGTTALAMKTNALVLPCFSIRRRLHHRILVCDPVDPGSFDSQDTLLAEVASIVDRVVGQHLPQLYPVLPPTPDRYEARVRKLERRREARARKAAKMAAREQRLNRHRVKEQQRKAAEAAARERSTAREPGAHAPADKGESDLGRPD